MVIGILHSHNYLLNAYHLRRAIALWGQGECASSPLIYFHDLVQCLAHHRCSIHKSIKETPQPNVGIYWGHWKQVSNTSTLLSQKKNIEICGHGWNQPLAKKSNYFSKREMPSICAAQSMAHRPVTAASTENKFKMHILFLQPRLTDRHSGIGSQQSIS